MEFFEAKLNIKRFDLGEFQQLFRIITNLKTNRNFRIFQPHFSKKLEILFHLQFHMFYDVFSAKFRTNVYTKFSKMWIENLPRFLRFQALKTLKRYQFQPF